MNEKLANISRPRVFSDVVGQDHPVAYLSGLILRGQVGRHLLLHGTVGSGKTTLARIYARALLCEQPDPHDGSPCGHCARCLKANDEDQDAGFYEYDVTGKGGDITAVNNWLDATRLMARGLPRRILFFDEAHGLTDAAADSLLKKIEEAPGDIIYCFATSEHHNLAAALRSRLVPLQVRPLRRGQAVSLLRRAAKEAGIEFDDEALVLLATMVNGQPRDLLNALGQLMVYEERITQLTLRRLFDFEYLNALRAYLLAAGAGNPGELNRVVLTWRDTAEEKLRWVLALLSGIYIVDILGLAADVDAVVGQLGAERRIALDGLRARLGVISNFELASYWRRLLGHWRSDLASAGVAVIEAQFVAFHDLVVDGAAKGAAVVSGKAAERSDEVQMSSPATSGFLSVDDVKQTLDISSFLLQEHGLHFNAYFEIHPGDGGASRSAQAQLADRFCRDLATELTSIGGAEFAALRTIEGSEDGITARIAVCIPAFIGGEQVSGLNHVRQWYRGWEDEEVDGVEVSLRSREPNQKPLKFHWDVVRDQLDALHPEIRAEDRDRMSRSLRELLRLQPSGRRDAYIAPQPLVRSFGMLAPGAIAAACDYGLSALSPANDRAWSVVFSGWEGDEHEHRRHERATRLQQLAELSRQYEDEEERQREECGLRDSWSSDPHARKRAWSTWWGEE